MHITVDYQHRNPPAIGLLKGSLKTCCAMEIAKAYGYQHINALDVENLKDTQFKGIDFNRLLTKENRLFVFSHWLGKYPYPGIVIKEIGSTRD